MPIEHASHENHQGEKDMALGNDQSEIVLTRETEFSRCLLESMADGVVACDADGMLTLFNRSARTWHGLAPLRLPPCEWARHYDLFRPDGITPLPTDEIPLARAFRGEIVRDAGMAIKAKEQPIRFILANGSVILDEAGQKLGAVVIMRDVTEFRRLELELRKANEELEKRVDERTDELQQINQQLQTELAERGRIKNALMLTQFSVDHAADGIMWIRPDGGFCYTNEAASRLLGYSAGEFLKMKTSDLNPAHPMAVWPLHWEELKRGKTLFFEAVLTSKDGTLVPVEIHANHVAFGDQEYNCASVRDISERKQAEEALKTSEERFRRLAENARDVIYRMSLPDGTYEYISPAVTELTGYAPEDFYGNPRLLLEFIHPDWRQYIDEEWSRLLAGEMPPTYEFQIIHKSGEVRWVNQRNILIRDRDGHPVAIEGIATDITERKRSEENLRNLNEELEHRVRKRTAELEAKNADLEKMNKMFVGRELRMVELKERNAELEKAAIKKTEQL